MGMQDEAQAKVEQEINKIFSFTFKVLKELIDTPIQDKIQIYREIQKETKKNKAIVRAEQRTYRRTKGKIPLSKLNKGGQTDFIDVSNKKEFELLRKYCQKHGVYYAVLRDKNDPNKYTFFFRTKDSKIIEKILADVIKDLEKEAQRERENKQREEEKREKQREKEEERERRKSEKEEKKEERKSQKEEKRKNKENEFEPDDDSEENDNNEYSPEKKKERENMSDDEREPEEPINDSHSEEKPVQDQIKQPEFTKTKLEKVELDEIEDKYKGGILDGLDISDLGVNESEAAFENAINIKERKTKDIKEISSDKKRPSFTLNSLKADRIAKNERESKEKALNPLKDITKNDKRESLSL